MLIMYNLINRLKISTIHVELESVYVFLMETSIDKEDNYY